MADCHWGMFSSKLWLLEFCCCCWRWWWWSSSSSSSWWNRDNDNFARSRVALNTLNYTSLLVSNIDLGTAARHVMEVKIRCAENNPISPTWQTVKVSKETETQDLFFWSQKPWSETHGSAQRCSGTNPSCLSSQQSPSEYINIIMLGSFLSMP